MNYKSLFLSTIRARIKVNFKNFFEAKTLKEKMFRIEDLFFLALSGEEPGIKPGSPEIRHILEKFASFAVWSDTRIML